MPSRNSWSVRDGVFLLIMVVCLIVACWYVARPRSTSTGAPAAQPPSAARTRFLTMRATTTTSPPTKEITPSPKEPKAGKPKDAQQAEPYELLRRSDFIRAPGAVRLGRANNTAEEEGPEARVARTSVSAPTTSSSTPPSSSEQPQGRTFSPGGGGGGFFGGGSGGFPSPGGGFPSPGGRSGFGGGSPFGGGGPPFGGMGGFRGRGGSVDPARSYAFTGTMVINGVKYALVEDLANRDSRLVKQGDSAFGMQFTEVSDNGVSMSREGNLIRLGLGENKQQPNQFGRGMMPGAPQFQPQPGVIISGDRVQVQMTQPTASSLNEASATELLRRWRENRDGPPPWVTGNYSEADRDLLRSVYQRMREQEGR